MGDINIKNGFSQNIINYRGNIGFTVKEEFRGNKLALRSVKLITPVLKFLELEKIYIICNKNNLASKKTIELFGAEFIEEAKIPEDYEFIEFYPEESRTKLSYLLII
ncbi:MAG: hypothetical protein HRT47_09970 [Candidatus Caenarcaniphilales bacterium]|nr:hypothetical protein [Candidatus Caenarcaniphilales bacterium]